MTKKDEYNYMHIALALCGIPVTNKTAELVCKIHVGVQAKKGNFSIADAVRIQYEVEKSHKPNTKNKRIKTTKKP
jgi:hypothetical protein